MAQKLKRRLQVVFVINVFFKNFFSLENISYVSPTLAKIVLVRLWLISRARVTSVLSVAHIQLTCWQGGQNHSPSGISMSGGLKQAVWYPLSQESHSKIWEEGGHTQMQIFEIKHCHDVAF